MPSTDTQGVPCSNCRSEIAVPAQYAHGDHIKCGSCGMKHKVVRGDRLRLVVADAAPLREALAQNVQLVTRLEGELSHARGSFGLGANGVGIAVIFALYQVAVKEATLGKALLMEAIGVAVVSGIIMEAANYLFLAKRHLITRLSSELEEARTEGVHLRQKIREAERV
jgi:hypothetical protein